MTKYCVKTSGGKTVSCHRTKRSALKARTKVLARYHTAHPKWLRVVKK